MLHKILRSIITLSGSIMGIVLLWIFLIHFDVYSLYSFNWYHYIAAYIVIASLFAFFFFIASKQILNIAEKFIKWVDNKIQEIPIIDALLCAVGLIVGLVIAYLISFPIILIRIPWISMLFTILIYVLMPYIGISTAIRRREELNSILNLKRPQKGKSKNMHSQVQPKVLDTSVIIDGRIYDLCKTGFIEGVLILPAFILRELRNIADSTDPLKRIRGRRGLDVLNKIQNELNIAVEMCDLDFDAIDDVDSKLLKLGSQLKAKIITNDYNLNKVAEFQGVVVLNINELANAVKPVVIPGEEMIVQVVKDGKESGQGVAYLEDGTMIVIDGGRKHLGETIDVMVTSVFQTAAGRMIFAKPKTNNA